MRHPYIFTPDEVWADWATQRLYLHLKNDTYNQVEERYFTARFPKSYKTIWANVISRTVSEQLDDKTIPDNQRDETWTTRDETTNA